MSWPFVVYLNYDMGYESFLNTSIQQLAPRFTNARLAFWWPVLSYETGHLGVEGEGGAGERGAEPRGGQQQLLLEARIGEALGHHRCRLQRRLLRRDRLRRLRLPRFESQSLSMRLHTISRFRRRPAAGTTCMRLIQTFARTLLFSAQLN